MDTEQQQLVVGMPIESGNHCMGYFGRDFYGPGRVEAFGYGWCVVRGDDGVFLAEGDLSKIADAIAEGDTLRVAL